MMKKFAFLILLLSTLVASPAQAADNSTKRERNLIRQGNELFNQGNYHEALQKFEQALILNPSSTYAIYNKARTLVELASDDNKGTENDPRKAAAKLFQNVANNSDVPQLAEYANFNLGNMAFNDNQLDDAIKYYKAALRINPNNHQTRQNLLLTLQRKEQQQQQNQCQQQQQQQQPMSQNSEQILQSVQNKENETRKREGRPAYGRPSTDKPW